MEANNNRNDMLERMKQLLKDQSFSIPRNDFLYLMHPADYQEYKRNPPKLAKDAEFVVDNDIRPWPYIERGTAYKISKSFVDSTRRIPIPTEAVVKEIENVIAGYFYGYSGRRGWYNPQPKTAAELRALNPNWSQVWDEWRYREDYKQFWIYRTVVKIKNRLLRRKSS